MVTYIKHLLGGLQDEELSSQPRSLRLEGKQNAEEFDF